MSNNEPETQPDSQGSSEQSDQTARAGSGSAPPDHELVERLRYLPVSKISQLVEPFLRWIHPRARYVWGTGLWVVWNPEENHWDFDDNWYTKTNPIIFDFVRCFSLSTGAWDAFNRIVMPRRSSTGKLIREPLWLLDALAGIGTDSERAAAFNAMVAGVGVVAVDGIPVPAWVRRLA